MIELVFGTMIPMARPNINMINSLVHTGPVADREFTQYSDGVCEATIGGVIVQVAVDGATVTSRKTRAAAPVSVSTAADMRRLRAL